MQQKIRKDFYYNILKKTYIKLPSLRLRQTQHTDKLTVFRKFTFGMY